MRKKNRKRAFPGDVITTTKNFKPKNKAGKLVDLGDERYRGMIIVRKSNHYGVRFGTGLEFTNPLDGLLSKPVGYMLERDEFEIESEV